MIKMEIEEFIYEVKDEILCYEELGEEVANRWEKEFLTWLNDEKIKKKNVKKDKENVYFMIDDESEIFSIADEYINCLEQNSIKEYWKNFN